MKSLSPGSRVDGVERLTHPETRVEGLGLEEISGLRV